MLLRSLSYGLVAHLLIGWAFFLMVPARDLSPQKPKVPVQIHFAEKPKPEIPARVKAPGPGAGRASSRRPEEEEAAASRPDPADTRYADLLPKATEGQIRSPQDPGPAREPSLIPGHQFKEGTSGTIKQKLMIDASILSAALDVPLHARRISSGSEAFLRLEKRSDNSLRIVALRGDPMLRAVLYENLLEPRVQALILDLMGALEESSLPLSLQALTGDADRVQDESDFTWIGRRLIIRKAAPPLSKVPAGAVALPDEDAKKAIIRDQLEFERYQRSPAYRSALHNHDIPKI